MLNALLFFFIFERITCIDICHISEQENCKIFHDLIKGYTTICEKPKCEGIHR